MGIPSEETSEEHPGKALKVWHLVTEKKQFEIATGGEVMENVLENETRR